MPFPTHSRLPGRRIGSRAGSLTARVIGLSSLWAVAAFLVIGGLISSVYERTAVLGLEAVIRAQLYNLVNSITVNDDDFLTGSPNLGELVFARPLSGWYWEVVPADGETFGRLSSFSLGAGTVEAPPIEEIPFDAQYRRSYTAMGLDGERLHVEEAEVTLDPGDHAARFRVMGNASIVDSDVADFNGRLALYLGLFGIGSILINALAILYGLQPLRRVHAALTDVRTGRAERLSGPFPAEIAPLAGEMNALIDNNRRVVERARTQVGNLAHSLKTPLAVLINEASALGGERGRLVAEQSAAMETQVRRYLDRARVAALTEGSLARTPVVPSLDRLAKVIRRLNPDRTVEVRVDPEATALVFSGEREDLEEMVGNLLENAAKWSRSRIVVSLESLGLDGLRITVEDDGAGLSPDRMVEAVKRGRRFDEAVTGSGLGLAIVQETVEQYRGTLHLEASTFGGLKAELDLPRTVAEAIS